MTRGRMLICRYHPEMFHSQSLPVRVDSSGHDSTRLTKYRTKGGCYQIPLEDDSSQEFISLEAGQLIRYREETTAWKSEDLFSIPGRSGERDLFLLSPKRPDRL